MLPVGECKMAKKDHEKTLSEALGGSARKAKDPGSLSDALKSSSGTASKFTPNKNDKKAKWHG